jgi:hypothetical protein
VLRYGGLGMTRANYFLIGLLICSALASCAPVILGRTPQPAAPDALEFSLNAGFAVINPYPYDPFNGPTQQPFPHPLNFFLAQGLGGETEVNGTLSVSLNPAVRLGGKTLVLKEDVPTAIDYGLSLFPLPLVNGLFLSGIAFDAGVLASYPQPGVEPYGALRGFLGFSAPFDELRPAGALTVGADIPAGGGSFFVEVTAVTTTFEGAEYYPEPLPPIGFSIVPALGYRF